MYEFMRGRLYSASALELILDVGGVGYKLAMPANALARLPELGEELTCYVSHVVRETSETLYGFLQIDERDVFEKLLSVSGIGPKMALGLIGSMSLEELVRAIQERDTRSICRVPGIGKKSAERLLVEMSDKMLQFSMRDIPTGYAEADLPASLVLRDALSALINLGYTQAIASKAVKKAMVDLPEDVELGTLITKALALA